MDPQRQRIEQLEHAFWQSMVDNQPQVATGLLAEPALMVSGHGAMSFDHAGYTRMARDPAHRLLDYTLSDVHPDAVRKANPQAPGNASDASPRPSQ